MVQLGVPFNRYSKLICLKLAKAVLYSPNLIFNGLVVALSALASFRFINQFVDGDNTLTGEQDGTKLAETCTELVALPSQVD